MLPSIRETGEISIERRAVNAEGARDGAGILAAVDQPPRVLDLRRGQRRLAAELHAARLGRLQPGAGALDDDGALELGKRADYVKGQLAGRRRGADTRCRRLSARLWLDGLPLAEAAGCLYAGVPPAEGGTIRRGAGINQEVYRLRHSRQPKRGPAVRRIQFKDAGADRLFGLGVNEVNAGQHGGRFVGGHAINLALMRGRPSTAGVRLLGVALG